MKKLVLLSMGILVTALSVAQPKIKFKDAKKNFGFVKQGKLVEMQFEYVNEGDQPLILSESRVECSCTEVVFPQAPLLPKQKAILIVKFNTSTVFDRQDRTVEIQSNASNNPVKIRFKGVVLKK